jgi:serine protease Do
MKNPIVPRLLPALLLVTATTAFAEPEVRKDVIIRRHAVQTDGPHFNMKPDGPGPVEMEKVAYLGVETMPVDPTVAAQLGLPRGTGVVIRRVAEGSPAAGVLKEHDILTKLDDQILINMGQLTVLVRNHRAGDEVKLTYIRGGKESAARVKLGEREVPKLAWEPAAGVPAVQFFGHSAPVGSGTMAFSRALPATPGVPVLPPNEAGDVMRVIGGDRMHWFAQPRVHVMRRQGGAGSTILDLAAGNFVFSDDKGSIEVNATGGKRELTVKDKGGKVTFQGPVNSPDEHAKLPAEVRTRLDAIGGAEFGGESGEINIETKVFEPASKIRFEFGNKQAAEIEPGMRTL